MLSLAQGIPEELTDRNRKNKKNHFNKLICCTLSKYPVLPVLQQLQEWVKDLLGRALLGFSWSGQWPSLWPWVWPQPCLAGGRSQGKDMYPSNRNPQRVSSTLSQPLGQNRIIVEEVWKKHLCLPEDSSVQKMHYSKPCSSSDQILWNLPAKHCFWSCSCSGLHKS